MIRSLQFVTIAYSLLILCGCSDSPDSKDNDITSIHEMDMEKLAEAYDLVREVRGIRSLLVAQDFELISEEYFNGASSEPDNSFDVRSVTKSFTSTLIGIAIDKGFIHGVDQTLSEFIGHIVPGLDEEKGNITLHQLMTMTDGLEWHEIGGISEFNTWYHSPDQLLYILDKPFTSQPGTRFNYSDGAAHLVSVILAEATGMKADEFAEEYLFEPLGIGSREWFVDNRGYNYGGVGLSVSPRDMLKLGYVFLGMGVCNNTGIVSSDWVEKATTSYVSTRNAIPFGPEYGYYWWLGNENDHDYYLAMGYGGQFILVAPDLELVVIATCNFRYPASQANRNWYEIISVIVNQIIPAAEG